MVRLTAHYDGKVLVPDDDVELPKGIPLQITIETPEMDANHDSVLALDGLGMEIWEGVDPIDYQRQERQGWE